MALNNKHLCIFSAVGIEIEYMIVDQKTLDILPISDKILTHFAGELTNEVALGETAISNELVKHVLEFKTNGPKAFVYEIQQNFHDTIKKVNAFLAAENAMLLPTGIHPWFDPNMGVELWPHGDKKIYYCYNSIFDCRGHGWSNLQSVHINLPFANDAEFKKLHNAIRIVLPLIPALTASSPFVEGKKSDWMDARLNFYSKNQKKIPEIIGQIVPEFVTSEQNYQDIILTPAYKAIAPYDSEGVLQYEWLNSRAAIARFDRMAIEIRIVDTQECPKADITVAYVIQQLLKFIIDKTDSYLTEPLESIELKEIFMNCVQTGSATLIENHRFLAQFNLDLPQAITAKEFWLTVAERIHQDYLPEDIYENFVKLIQNGNLAERILQATGENPNKTILLSTYQNLANCLAKNEFFLP